MTLDSSKVPPESYFEEQAALQLLVPRAKVLAALADALGTAPAGDTVTIPRAPTAALLRPFISCPEAELPEAWEAMLRIAATMAGRAVPPAAPGEIVKAIREYLGVHPDLVLGGQVLDSMALELSRIALDYPADRIGALALEELMQLGYTVEAGAILPPRALPENACEFFGVRPVAVAGPADAYAAVMGELRAILADADAGPPVTDGICLECGRWTPWRHPEAHDHKEDCLAHLSYAERRNWKARIARLIAAAPALEAPAAKSDDLVAVPRDLIGSACAAIDKQRAAPKTLAELRRYTTGDLSRAQATAPIPTLLNIAPRGKSWRDGKLIEGTDGHPTRQAMEEAAAPLAPAAPSVPQWIDDPHDIEHGQMLNPAWVQAQPAPAAALANDTALLDAMTQHRIAVVPENEGPWDAEVYGDTEAIPLARGTGATPREALSAALAAMAALGAAIQGGGAA